MVAVLVSDEGRREGLRLSPGWRRYSNRVFYLPLPTTGGGRGGNIIVEKTRVARIARIPLFNLFHKKGSSFCFYEEEKGKIIGLSYCPNWHRCRKKRRETFFSSSLSWGFVFVFLSFPFRWLDQGKGKGRGGKSSYRFVASSSFGLTDKRTPQTAIENLEGGGKPPPPARARARRLRSAGFFFSFAAVIRSESSSNFLDRKEIQESTSLTRPDVYFSCQRISFIMARLSSP